MDGSDTADSWFVGTIVAIGPLVQHFDCRKFVLRNLKQFFADGSYLDSPARSTNINRLMQSIEQLPTDCPDPLHVGDRVTFSWASGQQMTIDDERFLIMPASAVLAVLDAE